LNGNHAARPNALVLVHPSDTSFGGIARRELIDDDDDDEKRRY